MDSKKFEQNLSRLRMAFGKENFNPEKAKLIWEEVRHVPDAQATQIFSWAIGEFSYQYPPKVSHFREQAELQMKKLRELETAQVAKKWNKFEEPRKSDGEGLRKALDEYGAKSIIEAIMKTKRN